MSYPLLEVKEISKSFSGPAGSKIILIDKISLSIPDEGKSGIYSVAAPFGAGKTALLKIIAALENYDEGEIILKSEKYNSPDGRIIYIPEKPSSFPWMNVEENIEFAVQSKKGEKSGSISDIISLVELTGYEKHIPHNKSLGFRFRISLARALALSPGIILLDDCFKNMSDETKNELYIIIKKICNKMKIFFLLATANITEAVLLSDKIFLMGKNPGIILKEISIPQSSEPIDKFRSSEIFTVLKKEIEATFKSRYIYPSINISI